MAQNWIKKVARKMICWSSKGREGTFYNINTILYNTKIITMFLSNLWTCQSAMIIAETH